MFFFPTEGERAGLKLLVAGREFEGLGLSKA